MTGVGVTTASRVLVYGFGLHGRAVATALRARGVEAVAVDDAPSEAATASARDLGIELMAAPGGERLAELVGTATHLLPTPGLPDHHMVFELAAEAGTPVIGEFDLAAQWDDRPTVAVTGTNGKTTVTTLVTRMLEASGRRAVTAGNMDLPLVAAIADPDVEMFVVEASSFRLGHASTFAPSVGTWLNFAPDHLDVHASLERYEAAKARIWRHASARDLAVANIADPVVMRNVPREARVQTFGPGGDATSEDGTLIVLGEPLLDEQALRRRLPHDLDNALAAALTALGAGASRGAVADVLTDFAGLAHRMELVAERNGVRWYNDSKATTPHAVVAGLAGLESVVLIAGGRNKGVDLTPLCELSPRLRHVVAIGEAADEIRSVLGGLASVEEADSMERAVRLAAQAAAVGDAVVLSPACTSYDWYPNYERRGEDFGLRVRAHLEADQ